MARNYRPKETMKLAKVKRQLALERHELRGPSTPHVSAAGPTSHPVKAPNVETDRMVAEFLARRGA
jgi:hypothetical protein